MPVPHSNETAAAVALREEMLIRKKEYQRLWPEEIKAYLEDERGLEFLGSGSKTAVFAPTSRNDIVIAADFDKLASPSEAKRIYHVHKILNILFPHNFPKILSSFGGKKGEGSKEAGEVAVTPVSGTIRQRIYPSENPQQEILYPLNQAINAVKELGFPIDGLDYFTSRSNFRVADDGGEYYLDTFKVNRGKDDTNPVWPEWDVDRITSWMRNENYLPEEIDEVVKNVAKIVELRGV